MQPEARVPSSAPAPASTGGRGFTALRLFLAIAVLNGLLAFPVLYQTYKHFSTAQAPMDVSTYMIMVEDGPEAVGSPFRYRPLTTEIVRALEFLPGYGIAVDFSADDAQNPASQKFFFHFLLLNFFLTVVTSALLFLWLRPQLTVSTGASAGAFAWAGSLLYLFGFFTVTANLIPMTDAACHLAIIAAILCFDRKHPVAFLLVCLAGVFAKETLLIVLVPWILVHSVGDWKRLRYLPLLLPALAAYLAATRLFPVRTEHAFYDPGYLAAGILRVFNPAVYDRSFLFHAALGHLPLIVAAVAWAWLRGGRGVYVPVGRGLWVFFGLLWLGVAMRIDNNAARLAFMAFPAVALFQARVLEAIFKRSS